MLDWLLCDLSPLELLAQAKAEVEQRAYVIPYVMCLILIGATMAGICKPSGRVKEEAE